MIRVQFLAGAVEGVLSQDGDWTLTGPEPIISLLAAELNRWHGRSWTGSPHYFPDHRMAQAEAAAEAWGGSVLEDCRQKHPEDDVDGPPPVY